MARQRPCMYHESCCLPGMQRAEAALQFWGFFVEEAGQTCCSMLRVYQV